MASFSRKPESIFIRKGYNFFVKMDIHNINSLTALCLDGLNKSNTFYHFFSPKNFAAYHYAWGQNNIFQEDLITSNVMP